MNTEGWITPSKDDLPRLMLHPANRIGLGYAWGIEPEFELKPLPPMSMTSVGVGTNMDWIDWPDCFHGGNRKESHTITHFWIINEETRTKMSIPLTIRQYVQPHQPCAIRPDHMWIDFARHPRQQEAIKDASN